MATAIDTETTVEQRLEKLELQNRRLKTVGFGVVFLALIAGGVFAALVAKGAYGATNTASPEKKSRIIEAEAFALHDASGRLRAKLALDDDGQAGLWLYNENGKRIAGIMASKEDASLVLGEGNDGAAMVLSVTQGQPILVLADAHHQPRFGVTLGDLAPHLFFRDTHGARRLMLGQLTGNGTGLFLRGSQEEPVRSFTTP